jgi:hypothetical protein
MTMARLLGVTVLLFEILRRVAVETDGRANDVKSFIIVLPTPACAGVPCGPACFFGRRHAIAEGAVAHAARTERNRLEEAVVQLLPVAGLDQLPDAFQRPGGQEPGAQPGLQVLDGCGKELPLRAGLADGVNHG